MENFESGFAALEGGGGGGDRWEADPRWLYCIGEGSGVPGTGTPRNMCEVTPLEDHEHTPRTHR